jgi:hypothetical protein
MPDDRPRPRPHSIRLAVPTWLAKAVAPWRIDDASLRVGETSDAAGSGVVELRLRSERASIPVLVELPDPGARLRLSILDRRISAQRGASFISALAASLERVPELRSWLRRIGELAARLSASDDAG